MTIPDHLRRERMRVIQPDSKNRAQDEQHYPEPSFKAATFRRLIGRLGRADSQ
jgi:hypothetical protein